MGRYIMPTFFASPNYSKDFAPLQLVLTYGLYDPTPTNIQAIVGCVLCVVY